MTQELSDEGLKAKAKKVFDESVNYMILAHTEEDRKHATEKFIEHIASALKQVRRETNERASNILKDRCVCGDFGDCGYCEISTTIRALEGR